MLTLPEVASKKRVGNRPGGWELGIRLFRLLVPPLCDHSLIAP